MTGPRFVGHFMTVLFPPVFSFYDFIIIRKYFSVSSAILMYLCRSLQIVNTLPGFQQFLQNITVIGMNGEWMQLQCIFLYKQWHFNRTFSANRKVVNLAFHWPDCLRDSFGAMVGMLRDGSEQRINCVYRMAELILIIPHYHFKSITQHCVFWLTSSNEMDQFSFPIYHYFIKFVAVV